MSDHAKGPGWWQANNGKWYPPLSAPPPPPATDRPAAKKKPGGGTGCLISLILGGLLVGGCYLIGNNKADRPGSGGASSGLVGGPSEDDAAGVLACSHFGNIASDAQQGVLGEDQLLEKIREVWNDAQYSTTPGVREGARQLLSALNGNGDDAGQATGALITACGLGGN